MIVRRIKSTHESLINCAKKMLLTSRCVHRQNICANLFRVLNITICQAVVLCQILVFKAFNIFNEYLYDTK